MTFPEITLLRSLFSYPDHRCNCPKLNASEAGRCIKVLRAYIAGRLRFGEVLLPLDSAYLWFFFVQNQESFESIVYEDFADGARVNQILDWDNVL